MLSNLTRLDVGRNYISELVELPQSLVNLSLFGNRIAHLSSAMGEVAIAKQLINRLRGQADCTSWRPSTCNTMK